MALYIAIGGALGALARHAFAGWVQSWAGSGFPWGTFAVNVVGSAAIGFTFGYLGSASVSAEMRALITVGLLASFTTFSTFTFETVDLLRDGAIGRALVYSLGSLLLGILAVVMGLAAAQAILPPRG